MRFDSSTGFAMDVLEMAIEEVQDSPENNPNVEITKNGHYIVQ